MAYPVAPNDLTWLRQVGRLILLAMIAVRRRRSAQSNNSVVVNDISGAIGVATTCQLRLAIDHAKAERAEALIIRLDTPGGLVTSTRELIKQIIASPIPIVVYVAPSGARAASAGTFLVYASHVAAMAPGTNLGAATPIEIGSVPGLPQPRRDEPKKDGNTPGTQPETTAERKAVNDVVALLRSFAQLRGRNIDFAEKAVRDAATLTAEDAQKEAVIEIVASNMDDLLAQLDGRKVTIGGVDKTLATKRAQIVRVEPDLRTQLLSVISNPNVAFLLMMIGFYGIILEFWNPGTFVPGVVGGISLILALIGTRGPAGELRSARPVGTRYRPDDRRSFHSGDRRPRHRRARSLHRRSVLPNRRCRRRHRYCDFTSAYHWHGGHHRPADIRGHRVRHKGPPPPGVDWRRTDHRLHRAGDDRRPGPRLGRSRNARATNPIQPGNTICVIGREGLTLIVET